MGAGFLGCALPLICTVNCYYSKSAQSLAGCSFRHNYLLGAPRDSTVVGGKPPAGRGGWRRGPAVPLAGSPPPHLGHTRTPNCPDVHGMWGQGGTGLQRGWFEIGKETGPAVSQEAPPTCSHRRAHRLLVGAEGWGAPQTPRDLSHTGPCVPALTELLPGVSETKHVGVERAPTLNSHAS